jgi:ribonucleoside-diphosphate reductase alpha chain
VTSIAPTGTISIIAGCSSSIEPLFALAFVRNVMEGTRLLEANPAFEEVARERGFYSKELMEKIARQGTVRGIPDVPEDVSRVFVTDWDIKPEWHVRMQATFQKYSDNSVSKTVNLPAEATPDDVRRIYMMAYELKCKGITVYRYGSKKEQVLTLPDRQAGAAEESGPFVTVDNEYAGGCAWCGR